MRYVTWPLLACALCACLQRENVGEFEETASSCPDPAAALTSAQRELCIVELIEDLSRGPWAGEARSGTSGTYIAEVRVEFGAEGSFRLSNTGDPRDFRALFVPAETKVEGSYDITDLLNGEFFGKYEFETESGLTAQTGLDYLSVEGDSLRFSWRPRNMDFLIPSELMLTRQR